MKSQISVTYIIAVLTLAVWYNWICELEGVSLSKNFLLIFGVAAKSKDANMKLPAHLLVSLAQKWSHSPPQPAIKDIEEVKHLPVAVNLAELKDASSTRIEWMIPVMPLNWLPALTLAPIVLVSCAYAEMTVFVEVVWDTTGSPIDKELHFTTFGVVPVLISMPTWVQPALVVNPQL